MRPTAIVASIDDSIRALIDDLVETMRASPACVGLAANQIGSGLRVAVVDVTGHRKARTCHGELVLVNPTIVERHESVIAREGCMSVPDLTGDVERAGRLTVAFLDGDGVERSLGTDAFEARAIQHEVDHLDGHLFLDRVSSPSRVFQRQVYR